MYMFFGFFLLKTHLLHVQFVCPVTFISHQQFVCCRKISCAKSSSMPRHCVVFFITFHSLISFILCGNDYYPCKLHNSSTYIHKHPKKQGVLNKSFVVNANFTHSAYKHKKKAYMS